MRRIGRFFPLALLLTSSSALADKTLARGSVSVGAVTEKSARAALAALDARASSASLAMTLVDRFGDGDTIARFEQTHLGLPVIGRGATVRIDRSGVAHMAMIDLEPDLPSSITPGITSAAARAIAKTTTPLPVSDNDVHLVIASTPAGGRLAWAVVPPMVPGILLAPRILIDAQTGGILEVRDLIVFANKANVYDTNPITSMLAMRDLPITPNDMNGYLANPFISSQNCIDQKTVKTVSFGAFMLPVHICDLAQLARADSMGDFVFQPLDDPKDPGSRKDEFSEVSMYFHASKAYQFFRTLQGDPNAQVVVDKPLRTISNLQLPTGIMKGDLQSASDPNLPLDPFQNAFFSPAGGQLGAIFQALYGFNAGAMWFGQGPVHDYSYDGDVVYHEFTHAVVDQTLKLGGWHIDSLGAIDAPGAMNEGLADYFSSALAGDPKVGEYASKDIGAMLDAIRNIDNTDRCLDTIVGEVHFDSTFFSGGLWSVRKSLSDPDKAKLDAALYKSMRMNAGNGDLGYEDLVGLFLATLKTDFPAAATALENEMTKSRGILPKCERIFDWAGKLIYPKKAGAPPYYAGPGRAELMGNPDIAPGLFQVKADFGAQPAASVTVTFKQAIQGGGIGLTMMGKPFTPKLLVKFDKAITWTTKGKITSDADVTVDCTGDGDKTLQTWTASFDVPEGAQAAYLQIGNAGDNDGLYGDIMLDITPATPPVDQQDGGADAGTKMPVATSGCSCDSSGGAGSPFGALGLGAAVLALLRRRRV